MLCHMCIVLNVSLSLCTGNVSGRSIVLIILLILTCLVLFGLIVLGWFSYLLPKIRLRMGKVSYSSYL